MRLGGGAGHAAHGVDGLLCTYAAEPLYIVAIGVLGRPLTKLTAAKHIKLGPAPNLPNPAAQAMHVYITTLLSIAIAPLWVQGSCGTLLSAGWLWLG